MLTPHPPPTSRPALATCFDPCQRLSQLESGGCSCWFFLPLESESHKNGLLVLMAPLACSEIRVYDVLELQNMEGIGDWGDCNSPQRDCCMRRWCHRPSQAWAACCQSHSHWAGPERRQSRCYWSWRNWPSLSLTSAAAAVGPGRRRLEADCCRSHLVWASVVHRDSVAAAAACCCCCCSPGMDSPHCWATAAGS